MLKSDPHYLRVRYHHRATRGCSLGCLDRQSCKPLRTRKSADLLEARLRADQTMTQGHLRDGLGGCDEVRRCSAVQRGVE